MKLPYNELKIIAKEYNINLMILFGSYLTKNFTQDSDIDIAIQAENIKLINQHKLEILNKIVAAFNYQEIDLVLLNHADPLLKLQIAENGRLIYQKQDYLFNNFKVQAMNEHQDAKKFYALDEKFIENYLKKGDKDGKSRVNPPQVD